MSWPIAIRRAALVAFPIAVPLWLVVMALGAVAAIAGDAARAIHFLWTEPPKRRGNSCYGRRYRSD